MGAKIDIEINKDQKNLITIIKEQKIRINLESPSTQNNTNSEVDENNEDQWIKEKDFKEMNFRDVKISEEDVLNTIKDQQQGIKKPRIIVFGKTGAGKSTLINNMFNHSLKELAKEGIGKPVTTTITEYNHDDFNIILYDTPGIELKDVKKYSGDVLKFINTKQEENIEDQLHCGWYIINASGKRIEDFELDFIKEISSKIPVIVIFTHCDCINTDDFNELKTLIPYQSFAVINKKGTYKGLVEPDNCSQCQSNNIYYSKKEQTWICEDCCSSFSLRVKNEISDLEQYTRNLLPECVKKAWDRAQNVTLNTKIIISVSAIITATTSTAIVGFSPIPFSDAILIIPIQTAMFVALALAWGFPLKKYPLFATIHCGLMPLICSAGIALASALKLIPGVGTIVGAIINAGVAGTLTAVFGIAYTIGFCNFWKKTWSYESLVDIPFKELNMLMAEALKPSYIKKKIDDCLLSNERRTK